MAVRHEKAGQWAKTESLNRGKRILNVLIGLGMLATFAVGVLVGTFGFLYAGIAAIVVLGLTLWLLRLMDPWIERQNRDRIKYMRGAQAEGLVAWLLNDLSDDWHVFNNIKLREASDIDHVVVGPGGAFCISTKSYRGCYSKDSAGRLLLNGSPSDDVQQAVRDAMALKDRLAGVMGGDVPWIQPILAVPFAFVAFNAMGEKAWVLHQDDLLRMLDPEKGQKRLSKEQIQRLATTLEMLATHAAGVYREGQASQQPT